MSWVPNRIVLISRGRHDEAPAGVDCWPGMMLQLNADGTLAPHSKFGGGGLPNVAEEDALRGATIKMVLPAGNVAPFRRCASGDCMLMLLKNGQNVPAQAPLLSAGDGTLALNSGARVYETTAASTNITNTATETTFSNGSYTFGANTLAAGDVVHLHGKVTVTGQNATNTHRIKVYIGATVLIDTGALALKANDIVEFDIDLTIVDVGATGHFTAAGTLTYTVGGVYTTSVVTVGSTVVDTTATEAVAVKSTASAASAGNIIRMDDYRVDQTRASGTQTIAYSAEAIDNSAGTGTSEYKSAAFIRVWIP
jgi:hypothetical protein